MYYIVPFSKQHDGETLEERKSSNSDPTSQSVQGVNTGTSTTANSSIPSEHTQHQQQELDLEYQATVTRLEIERESPITGVVEKNDTRATVDETTPPMIANNNTDLALAETYNNYNHVFHHPADIPPEQIRHLDAVMVIGGGTPFSLHEPSIAVQRSLDDVIALMSTRNSLLPLPDANLSILCLSTGQPLAANGFFPVSRATLSAAYLLRNGGDAVQLDHAYIKSSSMDMIGSAFYARLNFVDPNGWRNMLVVVNQVTKRDEDVVYGLLQRKHASPHGAEMPHKSIISVSQLRMQHAQAVFRWVYNFDTVDGYYNLRPLTLLLTLLLL